ncbi:MAG: SPFH domain-containing protein [Tepidisphaeraceae bacterium]
MKLFHHDSPVHDDSPPGGTHPPDPRHRDWAPHPRGGSTASKLVALVLIWAIGYGAYFWFVRRVVVGPGEVMVLMKKDGSRSLPGDQVIVPRPPDSDKDPSGYAQWEKDYGDCNGILEQVYPEGTYFGFSPFDYEREVISSDQVAATAIIPNGKVGIVIRKFGKSLPAGQVLADPNAAERGPLPGVLEPGRYNEYANPYAYQVLQVDPVQVNPGYRGVVTVMAGAMPASPNEYLVDQGEQGTQKITEPEGFRFINPFVRRVTPISIQSQRFEMSIDPKTGEADPIRFPSSDGFDIQIEGFVEWSISPEDLPLIYVQYSEGGELAPLLEEKVILPYARGFCRLVGSQYTGRDFISGDTKEKFRLQFEQMLRDACAKQGVTIRQAWIRNIIPPDKIREPITQRGQALQQINTLQQQIQVAKSNADLATQEEMRNQNDKIGVSNKQVVTVVKQAEQTRDVAVTQANQDLEVAKLRLEAARQQAAAIVSRGTAEADVILLQKQAEAEPLARQVAAFGDGNALAQYYFYQKVAPSIKSILTTTDSPLVDVLKRLSEAPTKPSGPVTTQPSMDFLTPSAAATEVQHGKD